MPRQLSEADFLDRLRGEVRKGLGLVPFIGSGCSADSGILMGKQFTEYLGYTVWRCLDKDVWDLRRSGWPPLPNQDQIREARHWALIHFQQIARVCGIEYSPDETGRVRYSDRLKGIEKDWALHEPLVPPFLRAPQLNEPEQTAARQLLALLPGNAAHRGGLPLPNRSPTSAEAIVERAIRSLHDWRSTLAFLSELRVEDRQGRRHPALADADSAVIDSFNVHITRGRRPNPVHYMLSHLREPARMRVILTTNFDTMIEDAFQMHHRRLDVVPVSVRGGLPHPDLVHSRDTLVKLHGGLVETRADFSLDDEPSLEDRQKFFHYVRGGYPRETEPAFLPAHILVAGYSGSDSRCVQLLKFVLDSDPTANIFWLCHSQQEVDHVNLIFPEQDYEGQVFVTVAARFDLLLLELYQRIRLHLPPGGDNFPLNHEVPPTSSDLPSRDSPVAQASVKASPATQAIVNAIKKRVKPAKVFVVDGPSGVLPAMRDAAEQLVAEDGFSSIWLELEDCASTAAVAHHLFQAIANKRGLFQLSHALLCPKRFMQGATADEWEAHIRSLLDHMGITASRWLVVLYGRNGPGGCTGWDDGEFWKHEDYVQFDALLAALAKTDFLVLYAPYSERRQRQDTERKIALVDILMDVLPAQIDRREVEVRVEDEFRVPPHAHTVLTSTPVPLDDCLFPSPQEVNFQKVMETVLRDEVLPARRQPKGARSRLDFLYGLALFRQSRPYSALLAEGILGCPSRFNTKADDNDYRRFGELEHWLETYLRNPRVFLRKSGGFLWLYRDVRQGIRALVNAAELGLPQTNDRGGVWPRNETISRAHFHIAEWYERAFLVSGHAGTLIEAAFHFYRSAESARNYSAAGPGSPRTDIKDRGAHRWLVAVCQLIRVLRIGRASVRFWMEHAHRLDWFGEEAVERVCEKLEKRASALKQSSQLDRGWEPLTTRLVQMLRLELSLLGSTGQPAARIFDPLLLYGPELVAHNVPDRFFTSVTEALGSDREDWWQDPHVMSPTKLVSVNLLTALRAEGPLEPKDRFRLWRRDTFHDYLKEPVRASFWMQELVECAYISLRRATLDERLFALQSDLGAPVRVALRDRLGKQWVSVCVLVSAALEVSTWVPPGQDDFIMRTRSKAEAIYGLALAHLHRFYEAHRRLNHAHALALRSGGSGLHVMLGILELRRAEAYLIEAEVLTELQAQLAAKPRQPISADDNRLVAQLDVTVDGNRRIALCDDAWCAAERAEGLLAGRTHGSGWWVRLRTLQLWALSLDSQGNPCGLTGRVRQNAADVADRLFAEGRAAFPDDWHNRLRLLDYYLHAAAARKRVLLVQSKISVALDSRDPWAAALLDDRTKKYRQALESRTQDLVDQERK